MSYFANGHFAKSDNAGFIMVSGVESIDFLQSILTANVGTIAIGDCRPAALLTPQGRILIDMMVYRPSDQNIYLQTDQARAGDLLARLRRYRLRRPVTLEQSQDMHLTLWWGYDGTLKPEDDRIYLDPRHADLGCRVISSSADLPPVLKEAKPAAFENWQARRIMQAIPEGTIDLVPERALMLEAGLDRLGAVDFEKGCYVGQEVTARTHYRGLVKRRIVPVAVNGGRPESGAEISDGARRLGTVLSTAKTEDGAVCLAAMKLSDIHRVQADDPDLVADGLPARMMIPDWMLPLPDPSRTDSN